KSFCAFKSSTLADRKGQPRLMGIVLTVHVHPITAISFFQAHGVECSTAGRNESKLLSRVPQRVPKFQRKVSGRIDFISQLANIRKSAKHRRYMTKVSILQAEVSNCFIA